jgi:molybdopterin molybdotransferase
VPTQAARLGRHVRAAGSDVARGDVLLSAGRVVSAGDVALLTSQGRSRLRVVRAPVVAIIDTGDELVPVDGGAPRRGQVVASNAIALAAAVRALGGVPRILPTLPDTQEAVHAGLAQAIRGANVLITVGGMSVGDYDFMLDGIRTLSGDGFDFWKVAVKPGKPLAFAQAGHTAIFGLPGNPVSALVTFELFVRPALLTLMGHTAVLRRPRTAIADVDLPKGGRRETFLRAIAWRTADGLRVRPRNNQSSGALSSIGGVDALVQIPIDAPSLPAGEPAQVLLLGPDHPLDRLPFTAGA